MLANAGELVSPALTMRLDYEVIVLTSKFVPGSDLGYWYAYVIDTGTIVAKIALLQTVC